MYVYIWMAGKMEDEIIWMSPSILARELDYAGHLNFGHLLCTYIGMLYSTHSINYLATGIPWTLDSFWYELVHN